MSMVHCFTIFFLFGYAEVLASTSWHVGRPRFRVFQALWHDVNAEGVGLMWCWTLRRYCYFVWFWWDFWKKEASLLGDSQWSWTFQPVKTSWLPAYLEAIAGMSLITISQRFHSLWQLGLEGEDWTKGIRCLICHHVTFPNGIKCLTHIQKQRCSLHFGLHTGWLLRMSLQHELGQLSSYICWLSGDWLRAVYGKRFLVLVRRSPRDNSHQQCIESRSFSHTSALVCDKVRGSCTLLYMPPIQSFRSL